MLKHLLAVALLAPLPAWAAAEDAYMCRNGLFAGDDQTITLMHAVGKPRTYFLQDRDTPGCPADAKPCRSGYVLPGQQVLAGKSANGFICAFYPNKVGGSAGWVVQSLLAPDTKQPDRNPPLAAWIGKWKDGENEIDIKLSGASLAASGEAVWNGGGDNVNTGDFEATARPNRATAQFTQDDCKITAKLLGDYLIVSDNSMCGGMNVRFDGVYRR